MLTSMTACTCSINNVGCDQNCISIEGSYASKRWQRYQFDGNGKDCNDIDGCASNDGQCSQACIIVQIKAHILSATGKSMKSAKMDE